MKWSTVAAFLGLFPAFFSNAQNLVPNPDFETGTCINNGPGNISDAAFWSGFFDGTMYQGDPEYFRACGRTNRFGEVPDNGRGYQVPASGIAYVGLSMWWPDGFRQYIQTRFSSPMLAGNVYHISLKCSFENAVLANAPPMTTDLLGIYVSPSLPGSVGSPLAVQAQYQPLVSMSSSDWTELRFDYIAQGGEEYLLLGNFKRNAQTFISGDRFATYYYYIDDVYVIRDSSLRASPDRQICRGDTVTISALNGDAWATADAPGTIISTSDSIRVSPFVTTTYLVYGNGDTAQVTVRVIQPMPAGGLGNDVRACAGDTVLLGSQLSLPGAQYRWQDGSTVLPFTATQSGRYWVRATLDNCSQSDTIDVQFDPLPVVNLGADTALCPGDSLLLDITLPGATYRWQDQSANATYSVTGPGTYRVTVQVGNCAASDSLVVVTAPVPVFDLGNNVAVCTGERVVLNATVPNGTYRWQDNSTGSTYTPTQSGEYRVRVTLGTCSSADSVNVLFYPLPQVQLGGDTTLCEGASLVLQHTAAGWRYRWQDGSTNDRFTVTGPGSYTLEVTDSNGCKNKDAITVDVVSPPDFHFPDSTLCYGEVWVLDISSEKAVYRWQDNSVSPEFTVSGEGRYRAEARNACGTFVDSVEVRYRNCDCRIYVPNSFTPDGNNVNERFMTWQNEECTLTGYVFTVFDRWGRLVFETRNIQEGWDGKIGGKTAPLGIYAYRMDYKFEKRPWESDRGSIVLLR